MKDAYGEELAVGDRVVHALRRSCYITVTKRTITVVEDKRARTEWTDKVFFVEWDTPDGKWKNGAGVRNQGHRAVVRKTWIYSPGNVVKV